MQSQVQPKDAKKHSSSSSHRSSRNGDGDSDKNLKSIVKDQSSQIAKLQAKMKDFEKRLCELEMIIDELEIESESEGSEEEKV